MNTVMLPQIAEIIMGQSPPGLTYNSAGKGLPFFQGKTDFGDIYPSVRMYCSAPAKIAEADDILISVRAPVGPTNLNQQRSCIGRGLAAIRPKQNANGKYLFYFLRYYEPVLAKKGTGSTFAAINRDDLEEVEVPLPPLAEQRRIAAILARADRLRRLRRTALQLSDSYLQSVFEQMFGDPVTNPMGWDVVFLEELGKVQGGLQLSGKRKNLELQLPYLRVANVHRNRLDLTEVKQITLTRNELQRVELKAGDLLLVEGHGNINEIGRSAIWNGAIINCVHQNHLIRVRPETINCIYLSRYINSSRGRKYFTDASNTTSGLNTISTSIVKELPVLLPPPSLQKRFGDVVNKHERLHGQQREALRQAEHLFQTLLHRAFRGELGQGEVEAVEEVERQLAEPVA